jgi:WD40 repeat protein
VATRSNRRNIPRLSHEAVREHLLDYHFGRLSPQLNEAVERHVRSCSICQQEGLGHLATQKRQGVRMARKRVRRRSPAGLIRLLTLALTALLLILLVQISIARGLTLPWSTPKRHASPTVTATHPATATPAPTTLTAALSFGSQSTGGLAVAVSPNGKLVALATGGASGGNATVSIWNAQSGARVRSLVYNSTDAPGSLAWSPDGAYLAGAAGSQVLAWTVADGTVLWDLQLPQPPAIRVYDAPTGGVVQRLDPATAFGQAAFLQWGSSGTLTPAPASAAGAAGVATSNGPIIGVWQVAGTHLFVDSGGHAYAGISTADASAHVALLSWSPDGRYLTWQSLKRPVLAPTTAGQIDGTPAPNAATATAQAASNELSAPDAVAQQMVGRVTASGHGDALLWFSPDGHWVAVCDRTGQSATLSVMALASGRVVAMVPGGCSGMTASALAWRPDSSGLVVAPPAGPVEVFNIPRG